MKKTCLQSFALHLIQPYALHLTLCTLFLTLCLQVIPCMAQTSSTGATNPQTAADVSLAGSSFIWNNPNGALTAGGSAATSSALLSAYNGTTDYLQLTNFGFSIPAGSTIQGIQAGVTKESSNLSLTLFGVTLDGSVTDNIVQLVGPGVTSVNRAASGVAWPTSYTTTTYGSASDLWGPTTWSTVIVNSSGFGVDVSANINGGVLFGTNLVPGASIDLVTLDVTYSLPVLLPVRLRQFTIVRQGSANLLTWEPGASGEPGQSGESGQAGDPGQSWEAWAAASGGAASGGEVAASGEPGDGGTPEEFVVERSSNGLDWSDLATIPAGSGASISGSGRSIYNYTDEKPFVNGPTYYRLRLHSDGQADNWSVVQVLSAKLIVRPMVTVYPNPFHNTIGISAAETFTHLILTNEQGAALWAKAYPGGITSAQIPVSGLPQGLYFLTVEGIDGVGRATYTLIKK